MLHMRLNNELRYTRDGSVTIKKKTACLRKLVRLSNNCRYLKKIDGPHVTHKSTMVKMHVISHRFILC